MSEQKEIKLSYNCDLCDNTIEYHSDENKFYTADSKLFDVCDECKDLLKK